MEEKKRFNDRDNFNLILVRDVFITAGNIITPLGFTTEENAAAMKAGETGIHLIDDNKIFPAPFYASLIDSKQLDHKFSDSGDPGKFTRFDKLAICSIKNALSVTEIDITDSRTLFILSTTKGNIDLLATDPTDKRLYLWD